MTKRRFFVLGLVYLLSANLCFTQSLVVADSVRVSLPELFVWADTACVTMRLSASAVCAANEGVLQARSQLFPRVGVSVSGSYIGDAVLMDRNFSARGTTTVILPGVGAQSVDNGLQLTPHWGNSFVFEVSQVIFTGGALKAGVELAKLNERIAELDMAKNRQEIRFVLVGYYLDLVRLANRRRVVAQHLAQTAQVLQLMRARESEGVVLVNDLIRYELKYKQLQLSDVQLSEAENIIGHQLQTLLHRPDCVLLPDTQALRATFTTFDASLPESMWQMCAGDSNLDIRQAMLAVDVADKQVKVVRAASLPKVALVARDELFGPYTSDLIPVDANVNAWFVGLGVNYDLSSIWQNRHAIRKAKATREVARWQAETARERVDNDIHAAYSRMLTAGIEIETQRKQVELAARNYDTMLSRYSNDLALLTDLLDASAVKLQADMALVAAEIDWLYYYYQLKFFSHTL